MKETVYRGQREVRIEGGPDPESANPTDAVVRVTRAAMCGFDLRFHRAIDGREAIEVTANPGE